MIASDLFRLVLAVLLAVWHDAPAGVYAVAFATSFAGVFSNPAASCVLPALVPREALVAANTGIWTAAVLSQIVPAPLAGLLVVSLGYGPAFSINAASYARERAAPGAPARGRLVSLGLGGVGRFAGDMCSCPSSAFLSAHVNGVSRCRRPR